jgi:hypothetical protein
MNHPVMKFIIAAADFLLINILVSLNTDISVADMLWYGICMGLGFGLRVAVLINDNQYTHRTLFIHIAFTVCWCFFMILVWRTKLHSTFLNQGGNSFEIYLFINALFSVYMVNQFQTYFKTGFPGWLRATVGKVLAKEVKEEEA